MAIREELEKVTGFKRGNKESFEKYIVKLVDSIDQAEWDMLSDAAKMWVNEAGSAIDDGKPIPPFNDGSLFNEPMRGDGRKSLEKKPKEKKKPLHTKKRAAKKPKGEPAEKEKPTVEEEDEFVDDGVSDDEIDYGDIATPEPIAPVSKATKKDKVKPVGYRTKTVKPVELGYGRRWMHLICDNPDKPLRELLEIARSKKFELSEFSMKTRFHIAHEILDYLATSN